MRPKSILIIAAILGAIAVMAGAMGAHALKASLSDNSLQSFLTGTKYNMYHAVLLVAIAGSSPFLQSKWLKISVISILIGTFLFSGSIYLLSTIEITGFENLKAIGPITPIGGLLLIFGWISIAIAAIKKT